MLDKPVFERDPPAQAGRVAMIQKDQIRVAPVREKTSGHPSFSTDSKRMRPSDSVASKPKWRASMVRVARGALPPQSGQQLPGSSSRRSRGVVADTRGRWRGLPASMSLVVTSRVASASSSAAGVVVFSALAMSRSSSASSSCSISRSIFSEDLPKACFLSYATAIWAWKRSSFSFRCLVLPAITDPIPARFLAPETAPSP